MRNRDSVGGNSDKLRGWLQPCQPVAHYLRDDGTIPNSELPALIYRQALRAEGKQLAEMLEQILASNRCHGCWRNGIYPFQHYDI